MAPLELREVDFGTSRALYILEEGVELCALKGLNMRKTIIFSSLLLLQTMSANAQNVPVAHRVALACHADVQTLCRNVARGNGRVLACLEYNGRALSPLCRQVIAMIELRRGGVPQGY